MVEGGGEEWRLGLTAFRRERLLVFVRSNQLPESTICTRSTDSMSTQYKRSFLVFDFDVQMPTSVGPSVFVGRRTEGVKL